MNATDKGVRKRRPTINDANSIIKAIVEYFRLFSLIVSRLADTLFISRSISVSYTLLKRAAENDARVPAINKGIT